MAPNRKVVRWLGGWVVGWLTPPPASGGTGGGSPWPAAGWQAGGLPTTRASQPPNHLKKNTGGRGPVGPSLPPRHLGGCPVLRCSGRNDGCVSAKARAHDSQHWTGHSRGLGRRQGNPCPAATREKQTRRLALPATTDRFSDSRSQCILATLISARGGRAQSRPRRVCEDRQSPRRMKFRSRAR